jgi:hypothetical protein
MFAWTINSAAGHAAATGAIAGIKSPTAANISNTPEALIKRSGPGRCIVNIKI